MKIYMVSLLHRATIKDRNHRMKIYMVSLLHRATINKNSAGDEIANMNFYAVRPRKLPKFAEITQN